MRRLLAVCLSGVLVAGAAGCGNRRARGPDPLVPQRPAKAKRYTFAAAGISLAAPRNWQRGTPQAPLVAVVSSGQATIAVWRYPRAEPIPIADAALAQAKGALVKAVRARDRTLALEHAAVVSVAGAKGVELLARETIDGHPRRVRSLHLFDRKAEIVIDAYAPPRRFEMLDRAVFAPLLASVRLSEPTSTRP